MIATRLQDELARSANKKAMGFSEEDFSRLSEGKLFLFLEELQKTISFCKISLQDLLHPVNTNCYKGMVHCAGSFSNQEECDEILDLIDAYIDLKELTGILLNEEENQRELKSSEVFDGDREGIVLFSVWDIG